MSELLFTGQHGKTEYILPQEQYPTLLTEVISQSFSFNQH